jgi:3-methyl-2-oxobutanoate hydroxymethyltransferase
LNLYDDITGAIGQYVKDVKDVDFPNESESYPS